MSPSETKKYFVFKSKRHLNFIPYSNWPLTEVYFIIWYTPTNCICKNYYNYKKLQKIQINDFQLQESKPGEAENNFYIIVWNNKLNLTQKPEIIRKFLIKNTTPFLSPNSSSTDIKIIVVSYSCAYRAFLINFPIILYYEKNHKSSYFSQNISITELI